MKDSFPKKSLGQHWLNDGPSLKAICDAAGVGPNDTILEIGPGQGSLTTKLLELGAKVVAVEKDEQLAARLSKHENLQVVPGDILEFDLSQLPKGYKVVANIPYYLTSKLISVLCESSNPFSVAVLLVQKEVAERVAAKPGEMSILSVSTQFYCSVALGSVIPGALFTPPPKVDSQILILNYHGPSFDVDTDAFFRLVKAGFSERRKKLRSSLSGGLHIPKEQASQLLLKAQLDADARAQELSLENWHSLYLAYQDKNT